MELECPSEGCDYKTDTEYGLKVHHGQKHDEPYPNNVYECVNCEDKFTASPSEGTEYCSHSCFTEDSKGKNRGFGSSDAEYRDKEWLEQKLSEHDLTTIADECDVQVDTIRKWKDKHEIGLDYECPSCDKKFSSLSGRNAHHTQVHGNSIRGTEHECIVCGDSFYDNRSRKHSHVPQFCDMECRGEYISGELNPNKNIERRKKISKGLIEAYAEGRKKPKGRHTFVVEETGNAVDSGWEAEVDKLLHESDVDYKYNGHGEFKRYEIEDFTHSPDFIILEDGKEVIVEVKGGRAVYEQEEKMKRICDAFTDDDDITYIIYGDVNLKCDYHVEYGNEEELMELIQ